MTPEARARQSIDALLAAAGWHVCNVADANIHVARGVAIREFPPVSYTHLTLPTSDLV